MEIITGTEKTFNINWAGVSSFDNDLKISINDDLSFLEAASIFGDPEETKTLIQKMDKTEMQRYENFTLLKGIEIRHKKEMVITLGETDPVTEEEENADNN